MTPLLAKLETRDQLSDAERNALLALRATSRRVAAGQDLVRERDRPVESILLLEGYAARYTSLSDGSRQITAIHVAGDFVDLQSFLLHTMDHSVGAMSDCAVASVPHEALKAVTDAFPHLTRLLWLNTLIDSAIHRRWLVTMGRLPAAARLAHLICELYRRLEVVGLVRDGGFDLPLTQAELADVLGLSTVHVNRVVQTLRQQGMIAWPGRVLTVLDWDRLQAYAEFDPTYLHLDREPR